MERKKTMPWHFLRSELMNGLRMKSKMTGIQLYITYNTLNPATLNDIFDIHVLDYSISTAAQSRCERRARDVRPTEPIHTNVHT